MEWMDISGYAILRFWGILAISLLFYYLLFDRKASYSHCRIYLLCITIASAIVSIIRIPVYTPEAEIAAIVVADHKYPAVAKDKPEESVDYGWVIEPLTGGREVKAEEAGGQVVYKSSNTVQPTLRDKIGEYWNMVCIWVLIYMVVFIILALRFLLEVLKILRLKRGGSCDIYENICVVRNNRVSSPFSFGRTIFINRKLVGEALQVVLSHEKSHIRYRHYIDSMSMEVLSVVFWFNPFVWIVKNELRALHEYQVDHSVLSEGLELHKYQNIIFEELMGYGPNIANGLHNSLIKKRFLMMKRGNCIRYDLLRKLLIVPFCGTVIALFAFTEGEPRTRSLDELATQNDVVAENVDAGKSELKNDRRKKNDLQKGNSTDSIFNGMTENQKRIYKHYYSPNMKEPAKDLQHQTLREDQVVVLEGMPLGWTSIRYIETDEKETRVTVAIPTTWDRQWVRFPKGECLVDTETGDVYRCKGVARGIEMNRAVWLHEKNGKMTEFTIIYEPLKPSVRSVDFVDKFPEEDGPVPPNAVEDRNWRSVRLADYAPAKNEVVYNYLLNEQLPVIEMDERIRRAKLISFLREGDETKVTFVVPMSFSEEWINFSSGWIIRDCLTKKEYAIKSVERDISLDRVNMIRGKEGKFVTFTMVFPYVPMDVKFVDILEFPGKKNVTLPKDGKLLLGWRDIFVENNRFPYNTPATFSISQEAETEVLIVE